MLPNSRARRPAFDRPAPASWSSSPLRRTSQAPRRLDFSWRSDNRSRRRACSPVLRRTGRSRCQDGSCRRGRQRRLARPRTKDVGRHSGKRSRMSQASRGATPTSRMSQLRACPPWYRRQQTLAQKALELSRTTADCRFAFPRSGTSLESAAGRCWLD